MDIQSHYSFSFSKGILVEPLDPESKMEKILRKVEQPPTVGKFPANYATLYDFFSNFLRVVAPFGM